MKYFGNTTNLMEHLKRKYPLVLPNVADQDDNIRPRSSSPRLPPPVPHTSAGASTSTSDFSIPTDAVASTSSTSSIPRTSTAKRQLQLRQMRFHGSVKESGLSDAEKTSIDNALIEMIVVDYQPLSVVENSGFLKYSYKMNPLYVPPSRKLLTSTLLVNRYKEFHNKTKSMIEKVDHIAITTDLWSSDSNKSYITVTGHFIYSNKLYAPVLATREVREVHTGENIAIEITRILNEWNIVEKVITYRGVGQCGQHEKCH